MESLITQLCPTVTLATGVDAPMQASVYAVWLCIKSSKSVYLMHGQWDYMLPRLHQAFARYKGILEGIGVRLTTAGPTRIKATDGTITTGSTAVQVAMSTDKASAWHINVTVAGSPDETTAGLTSPIELYRALARNDLGRVQALVASGIDVNSETGQGFVVERAVDASVAVRNWFVTHPDLKWNLRSAHHDISSPMVHTIVDLDVETMARLPWGRIDLHLQDRFGNNTLHMYIRAQLHRSSREGRAARRLARTTSRETRAESRKLKSPRQTGSIDTETPRSRGSPHETPHSVREAVPGVPRRKRPADELKSPLSESFHEAVSTQFANRNHMHLNIASSRPASQKVQPFSPRGMTDVITLLLHHGSGTLTLEANNMSLTPIDTIRRGYKRDPVMWLQLEHYALPMLQRAGAETLYEIMAHLFIHIPVRDLMDMVLTYYTSRSRRKKALSCVRK